MLQLIYTSHVHPDWDRDLKLLCERSTRNNARDEITGILLCKDGKFLQVLEGPRVNVEDAFIRIITDPRHYSLMLLSRRMLTRREFGDWAMLGLEAGAERQAAIERAGRIIEAQDPVVQARFRRHFPLPASGATGRT